MNSNSNNNANTNMNPNASSRKTKKSQKTYVSTLFADDKKNTVPASSSKNKDKEMVTDDISDENTNSFVESITGMF